MTQHDIDQLVEAIDAEDLDRHRPEPRRPPPKLTEYVAGAALYGAIVGVGIVWRWARR